MQIKILTTLIFLALFCLSTFYAKSQADKGSIIIKATPITIPRNMWITVHGEYAISSSVSLSLGLSKNIAPKINSFDLLDDLFDNPEYTYEYNGKFNSGFSIDPEVRLYSDNMMDGFYIGAYSSFRFSSIYSDEYKNDVRTQREMKLNTVVSVLGPQFGFEKLVGKSDRFVFDAYLGVGAKFTARSYSGNIIGPGYDNGVSVGFATRGNVSIGYRIK